MLVLLSLVYDCILICIGPWLILRFTVPYKEFFGSLTDMHKSNQVLHLRVNPSLRKCSIQVNFHWGFVPIVCEFNVCQYMFVQGET